MFYELPYFTVSGIQVRRSLVLGSRSYADEIGEISQDRGEEWISIGRSCHLLYADEQLPWVRYVSKNGEYILKTVSDAKTTSSIAPL